MIPKIAHFVWVGDTPMSWLRMMSIATFRRHNPGWEIRLHDTIPDVAGFDLDYQHKADWTGWKMLADHGGFFVDTDIVFTRPVPEEWLEKPLCVCVQRDRPSQMAMVGSEKCGEYMTRVVETAPTICLEVKKRNKKLDSQSLGVILLGTCAKDGMGELFDQPMSALCHYDENKVASIWEHSELSLPEVAIGVHWYGGHKISQMWEANTREGSGRSIARLACQSMRVA